jgi:uncharacterized membrane protein
MGAGLLGINNSVIAGLLILAGLAILFVGFILILFGFSTLDSGGDAAVNASSIGIILIGPIPIVLASQDPLFMVFLMLIVFLVFSLFLLLVFKGRVF